MAKDLESAADVLQSLLFEGKSPLAEQFIRWRLWRKWPDVVGPTISAQTIPVSMKDGVLYIWVKNSVWMQQLIFLAKPVREKINKHLGTHQVRQIRFTLDRKEVPNLEEASDAIKNFLKEK